MSRLVLAAALLVATATVAKAEEPAPVFTPQPVAEAPVPASELWGCEPYTITGYVRTEFSGRTYDGTSVYADESIVAASWNLPIDTVVEIEGLGRFRVADRGDLGARHIDVAVWTRAEAFALTGTREVCRVAA
jgi:3D (Asp-Asp-Asp) domain-containing protein